MKHIYYRNNNYHFRVRLAEEIKPYLPKNKIFYSKSIKTNNKSVAVKFSKILYKKYKYIIESINMGLDKEIIEELVEEFTSQTLEDTEYSLYNTPNTQDTLFYLGLEDNIKQYQKDLIDKKYSKVKKDIDSISKKLNNKLDKEDLEFIAEKLLSNHINNLKIIKQNIDREVYSKPKIAKTQQNKRKVVKYKLLPIFEEYIKNTSIKDKWSKDTIGINNLVKYILINYFKESKDIEVITNKDLIDIRNILTELPLRFNLLKQFRGKDLEYIIENSQELDKISDSTINKYITRINQFFKYCLKLNYIEKEIVLEKLKNIDTIEREPYNNKEIKLILSKIKNIEKGKALVIKIALYSGMRLNEILQLRREDIKEEDGIYYFDINRKNGKAVKNDSSVRLVPIHYKIKNEVMEYIGSLKGTKLFSYNNKYYSKWYRVQFNRKLITKEQTKVFHSFRHSAINNMVQNNVRAEHIASVVGHTQQLDMTLGNYSEQINLQLLEKAINHISY